MFPDLQWIVIPMLLLAVAALLLWGMRRQPRSELEMEVAEILSDDPPPEFPGAPQPEPIHLSSELMQHRRLLLRLLGLDTPDLVVSLWVSPDDPRVRLTSHRHIFLPPGWSPRRVGERLEQEIFDGAEAEGIPEGSRLAGACSFVCRGPEMADLVVYSYFNRTEMEHSFFRPDADGKLSPLPREDRTHLPRGEDEVQERWAGIRLGHELLRRREPAAWEQVANTATENLRRDFQSGRDHAWLAAAQRLMGLDRSAAAKHLSLALEFAPDAVLARGERARERGEQALRHYGDWLHGTLRDESDDPVTAGCLLCGALEALWRPDLARPLAESLLPGYPRHPMAQWMRRYAESETHDRGAQA